MTFNSHHLLRNIAQQGLDIATNARRNARQAYLFNWFMIPVLVVAGGVNLWYFLQKANLLNLGVGAFTWAVVLYLWKQQARWLKEIAFWAFWTEKVTEWEARLDMTRTVREARHWAHPDDAAEEAQ